MDTHNVAVRYRFGQTLEHTGWSEATAVFGRSSKDDSGDFLSASMRSALSVWSGATRSPEIALMAGDGVEERM